MKTSLFVLAAVVASAQVSDTRLSEDEFAVYRTYLEFLSSKLTRTYALVNQSAPLERWSGLDSECTKPVRLEATAAKALSADLVRGLNFTLVDGKAQSALMRANDWKQLARRNAPTKEVTLAQQKQSEVAYYIFSPVFFDPEHRYAAMRFTFICGGTCGGSSILIFEKIDGTWQRTERICGRTLF